MPSIADTLAALPPIPSESLRPRIRELARNSRRKLVVLDDDPTGTQTVYDTPVLTRWDTPTLVEEFRNELACFYILTNSRSLTPEETTALHQELARNLSDAAAQAGQSFTIVSRSDSTLRGHFPLETNILTEESGPFDATFIIPYFEAGGRVTVDDVHYVVEDETYTPAADTPFAKDAVFGYRASNLREWVSEKTEGKVSASNVESITIQELRGAPDDITNHLLGLPENACVVVNAHSPHDVEAFALATLEAEQKGQRYLYRSAASFVAARLGLDPRPLWCPHNAASSSRTGGIVIVGSYVPKTSKQLRCLQDAGITESIELDVSTLISTDRDDLIDASMDHINEWLSNGKDVVLSTSRDLLPGTTPAESLAIGNAISGTLVDMVTRLKSAPRFVIAKGGITSSDIATDGLHVQRATVLGQILPGVPVWELGAETRFPGVPYIVFPGNVGAKESLLEAVRILTPSAP